MATPTAEDVESIRSDLKSLKGLTDLGITAIQADVEQLLIADNLNAEKGLSRDCRASGED